MRFVQPKPGLHQPQQPQRQVKDHKRAHEVAHEHRQQVKQGLRLPQEMDGAHTHERVNARRYQGQHP